MPTQNFYDVFMIFYAVLQFLWKFMILCSLTALWRLQWKLQFETAKWDHACSLQSRKIKSFLCNRPLLTRQKAAFNHYVLCSNDLTHDKNTIFFYNSYIINDLKFKGLIFSRPILINSGTSIILPIYYYTKGIMACQLTGISLRLRTEREGMTVLVEMSKMLFGEMFCRIKLSWILSLLFLLPKKSFLILPLKGLNQMKYVM